MRFARVLATASLCRFAWSPAKGICPTQFTVLRWLEGPPRSSNVSSASSGADVRTESFTWTKLQSSWIGVGSQYPSHHLGTWCIQHYYRWCARLPEVDWTDALADLNGLVRLAERRNLVSARVPSHFKSSVPSYCCPSLDPDESRSKAKLPFSTP
jgi:hypothetical protein